MIPKLKFQARKIKHVKYVKHNFGVESFIDKDTPMIQHMYDPKKFKEMKDGYYNPNRMIDTQDEKITLVSLFYLIKIFPFFYFQKPVILHDNNFGDVVELNYHNRYNILNEKLMANINIKILEAQCKPQNSYIFLRNYDYATFSYGSSMQSKNFLKI